VNSDLSRPLHVKLVKGRWYWDPPDKLRASHSLKTQALGADQAAAWAFARTLNRDHLQLGPDQPAVGTVAWVFEAFLASERFTGLGASTQKDYRWLARKVLRPLTVSNRPLGELKALAIRARHADSIYAKLKTDNGHATAHYACRFARRVWKWAARREMVDENPWTAMELAGIPQRTALWTPEQVADVVAMAREQGRPSIALATLLGYWFGHRQADVLNLTWTALDGALVATRKTGAALPVSTGAYPALQDALALARRAAQDKAAATDPPSVPPAHVVIHERTGRRYSPDTFRHDWRDMATLAGLPAHIQFRDLRATAMTELSDSGADIISMSTHSGHKTPQMARRYARPTAEQFERAAEGRVAHLGKRAKEKAR